MFVLVLFFCTDAFPIHRASPWPNITLHACGPHGKHRQCFLCGLSVKAQFSHTTRFSLCLKGTGAITGILQDVLPNPLHNHSAKTSHGDKFSHPREHPELKIHCWYFNHQTTIDGNMRGARSNQLKSKATNSCFLSIDYSVGLLKSTSSVNTVFGFKFSHPFTYSRFWSLSDTIYILQVPSHLLSCFLFHCLSHCLSMPTLSHPILSTQSAPSSLLLNRGGSPQISLKQLCDMLTGSCKNRFIIFRLVVLRSSQISFGGVELSLLSRSWGEWKMMPGHKKTLVWVQGAVGLSAVMQGAAWDTAGSDWGSVGRLWVDRAPGQGKAAQHKPRSV